MKIPKLIIGLLSMAVFGLVAFQSPQIQAAESNETKQGSNLHIKSAQKSFDQPPAAGSQAICPVSGKEFVVKKDTQHSTYKGKHYAFCCAGCKPAFDADPEKYLKKK